MRASRSTGGGLQLARGAFLASVAALLAAPSHGQLCPASGNDCCMASMDGTPGCSDATCCEAVCAVDGFCCTVSWDGICAEEADALCGICSLGGCPASANDCCAPAATPGCADLACCEAVCSLDPSCCSAAWDALCAATAQAHCAACDPAACGGSPNDCCSASPGGTPACSDAACCAAVCAEDPACCDVAWDESCATAAQALCGSCGAICAGGSHSCWEAGGPGCSDAACCEATCAFDPSCCEQGWDSWCVWAAMTICGPPPGVCGAAGHGPYEQGAAGCDDIGCCEAVCGGDPSCCTTAWDSGCVALASAWCGPDLGVCGAAGHDCLTQGAPGCDDAACCELVCLLDPSCCVTGWDGGCVSYAGAYCDRPACDIVAPPGARMEEERCGTDANGGCTPGVQGESSCCQGGCSFWYCEDFVCTNAVWAVDPYCVCVCWDYICAQQAAIVCPELCSFGPIAFEPIACGEVVYGSLWAGAEYYDWDTDWYELTLDAPALVEVTITAGLAVDFGIAETDGVPDCGLAGEIDPHGETTECGTASVSRCLEPGVHWIKLSPDSAWPAPCGHWRGPYVLSVTCAPDCQPTDPPNDTCETAIPLVEGTVEIDTTNAATEGSALPGCGSTPVGKDVWFTFDAPRTGALRISTCNQAVGSVLVWATGPCGSQATIACGNDYACPAGGAILDVEVLAGEQYTLRVGGWQGVGSLTVAYLPCEPSYELELAAPAFELNPAEGLGINAAGTICGKIAGKAITWSPETGIINITGTLLVAYATDLNDDEVVVGTMGINASAVYKPFVAVNQIATALPLPPDAGGGAYPLAINNAGVIVGTSLYNNAVRWIDGVAENLALPLDGFQGALDINQAGAICGYMGGLAVGSQHGFVWTEDGVIDIAPPDGASSQANAINDLGQVAGFLRIADPNGTGTLKRAFLWEAGNYTIIPPWPGFASSTALDLNNAGVVVGYMSDPGKVPFVWYGGVAIPVSELVAIPAGQAVTEMNDLNDAGQIVGMLYVDSPGSLTPKSPVRLTPMPPTSDFDCDGHVGPLDLAMLLGAWGPCPGFQACAADLDRSGDVGAADLAILLGAWG